MAKFLFCFITIISLCLPCLAFQEIPISFRAAENQPYFVGAPEMNIDAEEFTTVVLRMKSNKSSTARLFWATNFDPKMNEPKSILFFLDRSNDFKEYTFNLRQQNPYWAGFVGQLLIFPENGPEGIEIESAKAVPGNLMTNIKSGWREFWGPRGRLVIGSTINTIQSSNLFGRPIYVYVYWIIGLIALGYFAWKTYNWSSLKKKPSFESTVLNAGKIAFFTVIVFWGLLEISSLFNDWIDVKSHFKFVGKSYEEKLIMVNTGDFYPFIQFCEKNIPAGAGFDMRIPPVYNDIKTVYYLFPRKYQKGAEYAVVYDMKPETALFKDYSVFKTFREGAFILKKRS